jgi:hypothetical protein
MLSAGNFEPAAYEATLTGEFTDDAGKGGERKINLLTTITRDVLKAYINLATCRHNTDTNINTEKRKLSDEQIIALSKLLYYMYINGY